MAVTIRSDRRSISEASRDADRLVDFALSFGLNPVTESLELVYDSAAVAQAIKTLVMTVLGEWPHEPRCGTTLASSLFEQGDDVSMAMISQSIGNAVENRLGRYCELLGVSVELRRSGELADVYVSFRSRGADQSTTTVSVALKRVR